ncbi:metallophosphoesterase [Streptomyces griseus]|nr:metallophosphoesterase [Streptomyces griseus]WTD72480.1 metallophosphoesterase [Streptomyces griseus]
MRRAVRRHHADGAGLGVAGDITRRGYDVEYAEVRRTLDRHRHPSNRAWAIGNHEFYVPKYSDPDTLAQDTWPNGTTEGSLFRSFYNFAGRNKVSCTRQQAEAAREPVLRERWPRMTDEQSGGAPAPQPAKAGLEVVAQGVAEELPSYARAFKAVVNVEVVPRATVARSAPGASAEADRLWLEHAWTAAVINGEGCFLVRGADRDWVPVRLTPHTALSTALVPGAGSLVIAMSPDGRRLCALTEEDDDYWIVVHRFDDTP